MPRLRFGIFRDLFVDRCHATQLLFSILHRSRAPGAPLRLLFGRKTLDEFARPLVPDHSTLATKNGFSV